MSALADMAAGLVLAGAALWGVQGVPGVRFPVSFSLFPALVCFGVWGAAAVVAAWNSLREVE